MPINVTVINPGLPVTPIDPLANRDETTYVVSFNGRRNVVIPVLDDYQASLVTNDSTVTGATVMDALDTVQGHIDDASIHFTAGDIDFTTFPPAVGVSVSDILAVSQSGTLKQITIGSTGFVLGSADLQNQHYGVFVDSVGVVKEVATVKTNADGDLLIGGALGAGAEVLGVLGDSAFDGSVAVSGTVDGRDVAADGSAQDTHIADATIHFTEASIDHGSIAGLVDDDHTQYHNDTRGDARYYQKTEFITVSAGAADVGKPVILDAAGNIDSTMLNDGDISHNLTGGLQGGTSGEYYHLTLTQHNRLNPISAYGATLIDDTDAATARTTLGLGTIATQAANSVAITGGSITGITDLAIADGGTGASTAGTALSNLGGVAGRANLTTQYRIPYVDSAGTLTESTNLVTDATGNLLLSQKLIVPKTTGFGVQVDTASPTFPWRDLEGNIRPDPGGAGSPTLSTFRAGAVREYAFAAADEIDMNFHLPHDYLEGSDLYIHVHWAHNGATSITGNFQFTLSYTYAKGHNQANFAAEKSQQVTYATVDLATTPQYRHRIEEVQLCNSGGTGNFIDTADVEVDGLLLVNLTVDAIPTIVGGDDPFIFTIDLHYQSTNIGTKDKAPNFYT